MYPPVSRCLCALRHLCLILPSVLKRVMEIVITGSIRDTGCLGHGLSGHRTLSRWQQWGLGPLLKFSIGCEPFFGARRSCFRVVFSRFFVWRVQSLYYNKLQGEEMQDSQWAATIGLL